MTQLNRRNWLKWAGAAGAGTLISPKLFDAQYLPGNISESAVDEDIIRLSSNENPYGPSKAVKEGIIKSFGEVCRYPHQRYRELTAILAEHEDVSPEHIVICGGSSEGLRAVGLAMGLQGGEIIAPNPTFDALLSYAAQFGSSINKVALNVELGHDLDEMEKRISSSTKMIFLCNPNNPTGTIIPKNQLEDFCRSVSHRTTVFSDEAYYDYIEVEDYPSMVSLVKEGLDVIVSRTFSKVYGLAGLRIGYLIARPETARQIKNNLMAYTNMLALNSAEVALNDKEFYQMSLMKNKEAKEHIYSVLRGLGLKYQPSHTNFVFFQTGRPIEGLIDEMMKRGVRIGRPFPPLTDWCRISTGTMPEMVHFGTALRQVML